MADRYAELYNLRGKFIVLDGPDGSGKTTVQAGVAAQLREAGLPVTLCKDPGGTVAGDRIRSVLLDHDLTQMTVQCETLLFMASRAQLVREVVRPALKEGRIVLCDRFVSSTCAYQVAAGDDFGTILELARYAVDKTWPDLTLVLDVPVEVGFARIGRRLSARRETQLAGPRAGAETTFDAMERRPAAFHEAVRANFLALPGRYPMPVEIVDAMQPAEAIIEEVVSRLHRLAVGRNER
jgi:dTMP kinase